MTALGISTTTQDKTYSWADLKAKARHHNIKVDEAHAAMDEAWMQYDRAVDDHAPHDVLNHLRNQANEAERRYSQAWQDWQHELYEKVAAAIDDECTCRPDGSGKTCKACKARASKTNLEEVF